MHLPAFLTQDPDGAIRLTGHRIDLQDIVFFYNEGYSPVMLLNEFPTLSPDLVHRAITFYRENRVGVDAYIAQCDGEIERQRQAARKGPTLAELRGRLEANRRAEAT